MLLFNTCFDTIVFGKIFKILLIWLFTSTIAAAGIGVTVLDILLCGPKLDLLKFDLVFPHKVGGD